MASPRFFWECGAPKQSDGVRNLVNGIMSPFKTCVQPSLAPAATTEPWRGGAVPAVLSSSNSLAASVASSVEPSDNDVLCGRGGSSNKHPGNLRFRTLIAANKAQYVTLTKKQKMLLARQIVAVVHESGGKFLSREQGKWVHVGLPRSLEKTSQALRERKGISNVVSDEEERPTKSSKTIEAPPVIIPPQLQGTYRIPQKTEPTPLPVEALNPAFSLQTPGGFCQGGRSSPGGPQPSCGIPTVSPFTSIRSERFASQPMNHQSSSPVFPLTSSIMDDDSRKRPFPMIQSPSGGIQSRVRPRASRDEMDGMSALATAAFLRLDE